MVQYRRFSIHRSIRIPIFHNMIYNVNKYLYSNNPFLMSGTLLGYIRNNDLIEYDDDVDFAVLSINKRDLLKNLKKLVKENNQYYLVSLLDTNKLIHKKTGLICDIDIFNIDAHGQTCNFLHGHQYNINNILPLKQGNLRNIKVNIPNKPEQLLIKKYGNIFLKEKIPTYNISFIEKILIKLLSIN